MSKNFFEYIVEGKILIFSGGGRERENKNKIVKILPIRKLENSYFRKMYFFFLLTMCSDLISNATHIKKLPLISTATFFSLALYAIL